MTIQAGSRAGAREARHESSGGKPRLVTCPGLSLGVRDSGHGRVLACAWQHHLDGTQQPARTGGQTEAQWDVTCSPWKEQAELPSMLTPAI